jgi:two-component system, NtrC family, response regulator HydG
MRILIVDDDQDHAESIADILLAHGYVVEVALSGESALKRFTEVEFDVTLMDVRLPGMNGVETFFRFRKTRPGARVIIMTGHSVEQLIAQAVDGGAASVLHKPFEIGNLLEALKKARPRGLVLVADDDPEFAEATADILATNGYRADIARTGQEALGKLRSGTVDCLILDLRMPVMSGIEVFVQLRESGCMVPTILVTGFPGDGEEARKSFSDETLLIKPFDPAMLLHVIKAAMESRYGADAA